MRKKRWWQQVRPVVLPTQWSPLPNKPSPCAPFCYFFPTGGISRVDVQIRARVAFSDGQAWEEGGSTADPGPKSLSSDLINATDLIESNQHHRPPISSALNPISPFPPLPSGRFETYSLIGLACEVGLRRMEMSILSYHPVVDPPSFSRLAAADGRSLAIDRPSGEGLISDITIRPQSNA